MIVQTSSASVMAKIMIKSEIAVNSRMKKVCMDTITAHTNEEVCLFVNIAVLFSLKMPDPIS